MEIYLVRHTSVDVPKGVCYGQSDVPLSKDYSKELESIKRLLVGSYDKIYTSPLKRCLHLALDLQSQVAPLVDVQQSNDLKEMSFGSWELQRWEDIITDEIQPWYDDFVNVSTLNGESFIDLQGRVNRFINSLEKQKHKRVLIVTHAGVIRCFLNYYFKIPLKNTFDIKIDNASVFQITI